MSTIVALFTLSVVSILDLIYRSFALFIFIFMFFLPKKIPRFTKNVLFVCRNPLVTNTAISPGIVFMIYCLIINSLLLLLLFVQEVEVIEGAKALLQQKVNEAFEQLW